MTAAPTSKTITELLSLAVTYTSRPSGLTAAPSTPFSEGTLVHRLSSLSAHEISLRAPVEGLRANMTAESLPIA